MEINSGISLKSFLEKAGLRIDHCTAIDSSANCIYLPDKTSFNWKSRDKKVRVNCKENARLVIEQNSNFKMFQNGIGDKTRDYSLLLDNENDLLMVVNALRKIEGNII